MSLRLNFFLVGLLGALCGALGSNYLTASSVFASPTEPNNITASKITIVGKDGKPRITLGIEDDGAADLLLYNSDGVRQIGLGAEGTTGQPVGRKHKGAGRGSALNLFDDSGKVVRGSFFVRADATAGLELYDRYGKPASGMIVNAMGSPGTP